MQSHLSNNFEAIFGDVLHFASNSHKIIDSCTVYKDHDQRQFDAPTSVLKEERRRPVNIINQEVLDTLCKICFVAGECNCEQQEELSSE